MGNAFLFQKDDIHTYNDKVNRPAAIGHHSLNQLLGWALTHVLNAGSIYDGRVLGDPTTSQTHL